MSSRSRRAKCRPGEAEFWTVINELPNPLPVSTVEIEALERYFTDLIEECLKARNSESIGE